MRPIMKFLLPAIAASLTLAACGGSSYGTGSSSQAAGAATSSAPTGSTASSSGASATVVKTASNATLGATVLTDAHGMTLYQLSAEQNGKFICTSSSCLQVWHPVSGTAAAVPAGSVGSLGTVKRPDGADQATYKGMPLYTFAQDQQPGDAKGQGLKDVGTWAAVTIGSSGAAAAKTAPAPEPAPSSSSGGYRY